MINLDEGCKWEITKVTQRRRVESYSCNSNDIYEDIHFSITIKRKMPLYHRIVVIPALGKYLFIIGIENVFYMSCCLTYHYRIMLIIINTNVYFVNQNI